VSGFIDLPLYASTSALPTSAGRSRLFAIFGYQKFIDRRRRDDIGRGTVVAPMSDVCPLLMFITSHTTTATIAAAAAAEHFRSHLHLHRQMSAGRESIHFRNVANIRLSLMVRNVRLRVLILAERVIDVCYWPAGPYRPIQAYSSC